MKSTCTVKALADASHAATLRSKIGRVLNQQLHWYGPGSAQLSGVYEDNRSPTCECVFDVINPEWPNEVRPVPPGLLDDFPGIQFQVVSRKSVTDYLSQ